jgi:excisionase family DNA binding protein
MTTAAPLLLTVADVARELSMSQWSVRRLIDDGVLPKVTMPSAKLPGRTSRSVRVRRSDLEAFVMALEAK